MKLSLINFIFVFYSELYILQPLKSTILMRRFLVLFAVFMFIGILASAQIREVTGTITDTSGAPIPGATIKVKDSRLGTSADADGNFKIAVSPNAKLIISGVGFETKEVNAGDMQSLHISLQPSSKVLTEVVVTALGQTTNKAKVGYSTTTINAAALTKDAPVGLLDGVAGKVPGVDISDIGGPGASTKVVMRGYGVISGGDNQPLFVIDGVPMSNAQFQNNSGGTSGTDFGDGLNDINPNDVASITILKGTAASSLYGGLAKNGVVMITTKRGTAGKLKVEYNGSANFSTVGKLPDYQSEFGQGWAGVFVLDENGSWGPRLDGKERLWGSVVDNSQLLKPFSAIKNNLRDFYNKGGETNNSISLSGGSKITSFYLSYGNVTSNGIIPTKSDYLSRNTFSLKTNSDFGKFTVNSFMNYIGQKLNVPNTGQGSSSGGGVFESLLQIPVDLPIRDFADYTNKFFNVDNYFTPYVENPYYGLHENGDQQKLDRILGNIDLGYKFTQHFSANFRIGGDFTNARTIGWNQPNSPTPGSWNAGANPEHAIKAVDVGSVFQGSDYYGIINSDLILKYNKDFGNDFNLEALAGGNYYETDQRSESASITNLVVPGFFNLSNSSLPPTTSDNSYQRRRIGAYGQVTLSYKSQLFLTGNVRNDWSSTLPINNNSIFYPGANISWLASQNFISNRAISYLKLRAAYGQTGSDPDPYQVLAGLGSGNIGLGFGSLTFPFNGVSGFGVSNTIGNPNLKPIFTNELELGTDIRFLNDRIGLDVTYYDKVTKGQIFTVPIAPSTGYLNLVENLGTVSNKGVELALTLKPFEGRNFSWTMVYTYTKNNNKVESLTGSSQNPLLASVYDVEMRAVVGKSVASIYAPVPQKTPDGKIVVDPTTGYPALNQTPLDANGMTKGYYGSGLYNYTMGLVNTLTYKNFQLNFSFDLRMGGVMYSETADLALFTGNSIATTYNDRRPFIVPNSVNATVDAKGNVTNIVENKTFVGATGDGQSDDTYGYYYPTQNQGSAYQWRIFDRSFLKLRDISLSYSLPHSLATKMKLNSLSLGVYGKNFLLWTPKANQFVDPEATNLGNDLDGLLGEFASAPVSKNFGVILKAVF